MTGAAGVPGVELRRVRTNGIELQVAVAGPEDGPPVILLHGFPELWYCWRHQIPFLAERGYRVWAPDQRGYNRSDRPKGRRAYRMDELVADVVGLIDAGGWESARVVGHDWGGAVGWRVAQAYPERVDRLAVVNCPHPGAFLQVMRRSPLQLIRSSYVFFFQLPYLPELTMGPDGAALERAMRVTADRRMSEEERAVYREAWAQPGALTAMLNWYRAVPLASRSLTGRGGLVRPPTLIVWGTGDRFLGEELIPPSLARCADGRVVRLEGVTHWVQWEAPERLNAALKEFL